ncbi:hypothetical protein [Candidatus Poriferisodalis sp.]|uniref:hypothetical protein n=1 Tax=Candidatus Poriferisodalis sp. TaxID=3101277 RepID=UPI003B021029
MTDTATTARRKQRVIRRAVMLVALALGAALGSWVLVPLLTLERVGSGWWAVTRVAALLAIGIYVVTVVRERRRKQGAARRLAELDAAAEV